MAKMMMNSLFPQDGAQPQVEEMTMETIVALAVVTLTADRQSTVKEAYVNQRRSSRSRNRPIVVRYQNNM